jgi:hypothetical protein
VWKITAGHDISEGNPILNLAVEAFTALVDPIKAAIQVAIL